MTTARPVRRTAAIGNVKVLALAIPAGMAISPWASFVFAALWLLPEWVEQWLDVVKHALDVRDRGRR